MYIPLKKSNDSNNFYITDLYPKLNIHLTGFQSDIAQNTVENAILCITL